MTQKNDHDFQQFRGAFDDAMMPDAAFKAKMEKLLQSEKPVEPERATTVLASPPRKQSETVIPTRRSHPLMIAVAVVMVFAVAIASVWVLSGDVLEGEYASAPSGIATLPANAPGMPGEDVQLVAELIPGTEDIDYLNGIFDGVAIYQSRSTPFTEPGEMILEPVNTQDRAVSSPVPYVTQSSIIAVDVETGEHLWEIQNTSIEGIVLEGNILIGRLFESWVGGEIRSYSLIAIQLQSGDILWEVLIEETPDPFFGGFPPFSVGNGKVVYGDPDGNLTALDVESGEIVWETTFDPGIGYPPEFVQQDGTSRKITVRNVSSVVWRDYIVIANGDGLLQVIDLHDGEAITSHQILDTETGTHAINQLGLHPHPAGVLVVRDVPSSDGLNSEAVLLNPVTGEVAWSQTFEGSIGVWLAEDGTIAMSSHTWQENSWFLQLIGRPGYSTTRFLWVDGASGEEILSTERARSEYFVFALTDGHYGCTRSGEREVVCFNRDGTRHLLEVEPWIIPMLFDGVLYVPTADGVSRVELP